MHLWFSSWTLSPRAVADYVALQQHDVQFLKGDITMVDLKTLSDKLNAWRRYREAVRELSQLSDRELADIGVRRGDIETIARRGAFKAA